MAETTKDTLSRGAILTAYGTNYLLSVCPAFGIDKVRFSIVKNGTSGKDSSDIHISVKDFMLFCQDIDAGIAEKKIAADNGPYPTAYQWVKGENGSKKLTIGGGQKGVRVQTQIFDGKNTDRKMTVIQIDDLKWMSYLFKLVLGQIPYAPGSLLEDWVKTYQKASSKYVHRFDEKTDGDYVPKDDAPSVMTASVAPATQKPAVTGKTEKSGDEVREFYLLTCSDIGQKGEYLTVECKLDENNKVLVLFDKTAQQQEFFPVLCEAVKKYKKSGVKLNIKGVLRDKFILYKERLAG